MGINKKAYYFSIDAFVALLLIIGVVVFIKPSANSEIHQEEFVHRDLIDVLSSLKIGEMNNTYVEQLIANKNITNLNQSVLEQIGEFYSNNPTPQQAQDLAMNVLEELNLSKNIGLYFEGIKIITSGAIPYSESKEISTARQTISGVQAGASAKGYASRAFLFSENKVDYYYFGGYVGDGNITALIQGNVIGAKIEGVFSGSFDLYINGAKASRHTPTANQPYTINLANNLSMFISGDNEIDFKTNSSFYIAGGFIRTVFNETTANGKKHLPGIEGIANIYDGFYVPGEIDGMELFLHYNSSFDVFFKIGNKTVYEGNSSGSEDSITIDNSTLSGILNYPTLSKTTVPIRYGLVNASYIFNESLQSDVFSVTDLSGSMLSGSSAYEVSNCNNVPPGGCCWDVNIFFGIRYYQRDECRLGSAKIANNIFMQTILGTEGNRLGLIGYQTWAVDSASHDLSNNSVTLNDTINNWEAGGNTCICCGINEAKDRLSTQSNESRFKSMIVMSDGAANAPCAEQGVTGDLDGDGTTDTAKDDAIQAACDAFNDKNITVYAVGFGEDVDQTTLEGIASCGNGDYHSAENLEEIIEKYEQIAQDIYAASYFEQTVVGKGISSRLFPDSYLSFDYYQELPHGMIITSETPEFGNPNGEGTFTIPENSTPYEARVISYSGSKWTSRVNAYNNATGNWESVYEITDYNDSYINLGDPYFVEIPQEKLVNGENKARVFVGLNNLEYLNGSEHDKIIYSVVKNISSYSPIVAIADGCSWNIEFEDGSTSIINIPPSYSGPDICYYNSTGIQYRSNDAIEIAIYNLLQILDLNHNQKIETKFEENDLSIDSIEISGIPFTWETEVQIRTWK